MTIIEWRYIWSLSMVFVLSACAAGGQVRSSASTQGIQAGRMLPLSNSTLTQRTYIQLPKSVDPTGKTYPVVHGTRVFAVPQHLVTYADPNHPDSYIGISVYGNIMETMSGNQLTISNDVGQTWHFPRSAKIQKQRPAFAFVAPGKTAPRIAQHLSPIAVAP